MHTGTFPVISRDGKSYCCLACAAGGEDTASMHLSHGFNDSQAQAMAIHTIGARDFDPVETVEYPVQMARWDFRTPVRAMLNK